MLKVKCWKLNVEGQVLMVKGWRSKVEYQDMTALQWTYDEHMRYMLTCPFAHMTLGINQGHSHKMYYDKWKNVMNYLLEYHGWDTTFYLWYYILLETSACNIQPLTFDFKHPIFNIQPSTFDLNLWVAPCKLKLRFIWFQRMKYNVAEMSLKATCPRMPVEVWSLHAKENPYLIFMDITFHIAKYLKKGTLVRY